MPPQQVPPPHLIAEEAMEGLVVIVDPYSTGCLVAQEISKRGYQIVALWSDGFAEAMKSHVPQSCGTLHWFAQLDEAKTLAATGALVRETARDINLVACIAGGEAGVDLADKLSEHLGLRTNGTEIPNRRDKKVQQELIKAAGLRSVRQAGGDKFEDVEEFLRTESYPVVLKPIESAGSDGVKLCYTFEEAKEHFELLMKSQMVNGGACPAVLCQEFLRGTEYVVDQVSLDGVHKTVMVWVYDKRPANGNAFVYFGCVPVDSESPEAKLIIPYVRKVLDCMGVKNGPSHGEVMITKDGPCLVEMNCRAHGGDGNWRPLCKALTGGYSQVEATADCTLDPEKFARLPDKPCSPFKASGLEVILVSFSRGKVKALPGYEVMKALPSFLSLETGVKPGTEVDYTIDLNTGIGSVMLMHPDEEVIKRDTDFIRYMEKINGIFSYETKLENLKRPRGETVLLDTYEKELLPPISPKMAGKKPPRPHRRVFSADGPMLIRHMSNDRPELRGPLVKRMTTVDASKEVVVVVDPYSTACCVAQEIIKRGYKVMALWTKGFAEEMKTHVPLSVGKLDYLAEIDEAETLADTVTVVYKAANQYRVVACIAGGEAGVDFADALSERMNLRTNGTAIPNKRDKKLQQELIGARGMRAVRQAGGAKFEEVESFLKTEPYPLVLKPVESAGSDGVKLCHTFEEAKEHFNVLMESQMVNGGDCPAVLCQEFLRGKEYVVDHVSRDGVHKTVMVWVYDKRPVNGSAFVYFGCVPVASDSPEARILIPYVRKVLDALGIKNGPSHGEVMMTKDGPCLVEMNCRAHGGDGNWRPLCVALNGGYSQVEATADAYLDKRQFSLYADKPPAPFKAAGQEVILVSFSRGVVKSTPGFEKIKKLQSYVYLETGVRPGSEVDYTIDLFTGIGSVILMHHDTDILEKDVNFIRKLERDNALFEYEDVYSMMKSPSTGNLLESTFVSDRAYE
ncbi:Inherit from NOG: acetyl-CoA carboxylase biotin carboxylase [Seminavis robusta]|uniref:Inherit from NOG: acetyl-CoA carboxylase biotin carboxylase n=1 Tax=Seminavis robusta TaxID=568900 RepID=A0A9N8HQ82_9STRA|nr:Inherit from NOG: acetyl-CoA carboxylase biotin carboxylase [Seminavis robusta]|eukprot:Sro1142_g245810.1 Inherit from NOG: acetyl-CoA carboxylase biotin carboxylase (966) ;mRNA; r:17769-20918